MQRPETMAHAGAVAATVNAPATTAPERDDSAAPMTAEIARIAAAQVTIGAVIELVASVEGAALVLRNVGLKIDPIRVVQWQFREAIRGVVPWDPAGGTFFAHLKASAWARLSAHADRVALARAYATGNGLDVLRVSIAQVGTLVGVRVAAQRLAELMPLVRATDMTYVSVAGVLRDVMRRELARIAATPTPTDGVVAQAITGEETGPVPGCDGVTDAAP